MTSKIGDTQDLKNIEEEWSEKDPRILEAARKLIEEEKITEEEEKKLQEVYLQYGKEAEYKYQTQQEYLFYQHLPDLIKNYSGRYVWFEDGEVKDSDLDEVTLASRVVSNERVKSRDVKAVYITQVPEINL